MSLSKLAIYGGMPAVTDPFPHFKWPPAMPGLGNKVAEYIHSGKPLSIVDRSGLYEELEDRFCELHNRRYAIAVSSGTMALMSAFFGIELKPGDEVISTVYSFHATATPLLHLGVKIIFCDIEPDTGNIDTSLIDSLISKKTRAIVTNHMWGHPVAVDEIRDICRKKDLLWIEDCSHAHFSAYKNRFVGSFGDASVFSLQGNKLLTGGEGGILLTDSQSIYERATLFGHSLKRTQQCVHDPHWEGLCRTGYGLKLRMHPLAALIVLYILDNHCFEWINSRMKTLDYFTQSLAYLDIVQPMTKKSYVTSMGAHYGFKPKIDFNSIGVQRKVLVDALKAEGLKISVPGSQPFHRLPIFDCSRYPIGHYTKSDHSDRSFPGAEQYWGSIISLPTFTFRSDFYLIDKYVAAFKKVLDNLEELK
jgi:perosamine synthetase